MIQNRTLFWNISNFSLFPKGPFIYDDTVFGGGGQGFCDNSAMASVIKSVTMGDRGKNCSKLRDVIYGQPQSPSLQPPVSKAKFISVWSLFDSSNAVLGDTFTHTPLKKGNQTFVLRRQNLYCIESKTKKSRKKLSTEP